MSATGDKINVRELMKKVVEMNNTTFMITKMAAERLSILPEGISREAVLGFSASNFLSASRLNPIAEFLAKIMHNIMSRNSLPLN